MKYHINNNYNLCINTQIFMLFDLYVMQSTVELTTNQIDTLQTGLKENTVNLATLVTDNSIDVYSKIISNVTSSMTVSSYDLNHKPMNKISINTSGAYSFNIPVATKTLLVFQIKKFDNLNYIAPLLLEFDDEYMNSVNRRVNADNFFEELNSKKEQAKLLSKFNILAT